MDKRRVPKNGVSRSKRLLKPHPLPHQYRAWELRTSLTEAGDGAKCGAKFADTCCITVDEANERDIDESITPERIAQLLQ